jgi:hypothetical protein
LKQNSDFDMKEHKMKNATLMIGAVVAQILVRPWSQTNDPPEARSRA